jgi:hypothetical protein
MSVKSSTELMLYVVLTMPTLNKAYLFIIIIYLFIIKRAEVGKHPQASNFSDVFLSWTRIISVLIG